MANKYLDTELLDRAIIFAVKAHHNTERRGKGFPYIVHPLEAMEIVATITPDQELLAAAALHDVIEDTEVTVDELREMFGERIARLVHAESDQIDGVLFDGQNEEETWHARKQAAIDRLAAAPHDALWSIFHVKDKASHEWHYRGLADSLSELSGTFAYQEFVRLIDEVFA